MNKTKSGNYKVYKVVSQLRSNPKINYSQQSVHAKIQSDLIKIQYTRNRWTIPKIKDSLLFCFLEFSRAEIFATEYCRINEAEYQTIIFEAYTDIKPVKIWRITFTCFEDTLKEFWQNNYHISDSYQTSWSEPPTGTYGVPRLMLRNPIKSY